MDRIRMSTAQDELFGDKQAQVVWTCAEDTVDVPDN